MGMVRLRVCCKSLGLSRLTKQLWSVKKAILQSTRANKKSTMARIMVHGKQNPDIQDKVSVTSRWALNHETVERFGICVLIH